MFSYCIWPFPRTIIHDNSLTSISQRLEASKSDMGDKGATMLQKAHGFVDLLTEKNIYIDELAEQKRSKLEQNIQYMHFEKEAKQVNNNSTQIHLFLSV